MTVLPARTCACGTKFVPKSGNHKFCSKSCRKGKKETAEPQYILTDVSNHLLAAGPSALSCAVTETQDGDPCLVMTIRTTSTTLTVVLSPSDAVAWLAEFAQKVKGVQDAARS